MAVVSARSSPHSDSSPLPPLSPQPVGERMFMRGGSGRSPGSCSSSSSSSSPSLRDIEEEAAVVVDDGGGKLYVAVGKDFKDGKSTLSAAQSLGPLGGDLSLVLLHVHQPKSKVAAIVHQQAKPYCQILFIRNGSLAWTRYEPFLCPLSLIGVCRDPKVLVYEFLPNGSLEDRLQCKHHSVPLPWRMRIRIAADICTVLMFLHSNKPKSIAHGDLKPDNVLLDTNFVGKPGDFGISRSLNLTNTTVTPYHRTDQIKGTLGYMDPGYIASGELTAQYDVYSFGVVLLRLLTGKSPLGLQSEAEAALSSGVLHEILDASAGNWPPVFAEELASLALKCCKYERKECPDLAKEAWGILQDMMNEPTPSSTLPPEAPSYFIVEHLAGGSVCHSLPTPHCGRWSSASRGAPPL